MRQHRDRYLYLYPAPQKTVDLFVILCYYGDYDVVEEKKYRPTQDLATVRTLQTTPRNAEKHL
jgi:hypothetical protein